MENGRSPKFTPRRKRIFLKAYAETGLIGPASAAAGITRSTYLTHCKSDLEFAEACKQACELATDNMEKEAQRRAFEGVKRFKVSGGKVVMAPPDPNAPAVPPTALMELEYSDRLAELLLKGNRPDKFRERIEHSGNPDQPIVVQMLPGDASL